MLQLSIFVCYVNVHCEKVTKASLHTVLNCLLANSIRKCFIDGKYKKLIDIISNPQILITIYEHLKLGWHYAW
jgi:hypothetical protein